MKLFVLAACAVLLSATANARTVDLVCKGFVIDSNGQPATVNPTGTRVDLDNRQIITPLGKFKINAIGETAIYFGGIQTAGNLMVDGRLDRGSGKMTVFWFNPQEWAKHQAGQPASMVTDMNLECSVSKRLF
jgi:hypothetical protein